MFIRSRMIRILHGKLYLLSKNDIVKRICHQLTKNDETAIISNMMKQGRFRKAARGAFLTLLFFYYNMNDISHYSMEGD